MVRDRCARMDGAGRTKHTSNMIHHLSKTQVTKKQKQVSKYQVLVKIEILILHDITMHLQLI